MDPLWISENEPYAQHRTKALIQECYLISRFCNTSYTDALKITPLEREYLLDFIKTEIKEKPEAYEKLSAQNKRG